jgi:large subunit ribosomal protein L22
MTGPKTNERPGTRAQARYVRTSAYKAREVLDLIRGKSYAEASQILKFTERGIAEVIGKVLDSAVANAENNDGQVAEELYVSACYADEGPTLKRFRPRARGRGARIRKRTCHITVIVSRLPADVLDAMRAREAARGSRTRATAAEARRRRVAQSREREAAAAAAAEEHDHDHDHDHDHEHEHEHEHGDEASAVEATDDDEAAEVEASEELEAAEVEASAVEASDEADDAGAHQGEPAEEEKS